MRINTKIVVDLTTDKVIERESYEYRGPLAQAVTGSTPTKIAEWSVRGGVFEIYQSSVAVTAISAGAEQVETFAITGARSGDIVFANVQDPDTPMLQNGAKVTATDVVSVWLVNNNDATTASGTATLSVDILILKRSVAPSA